MCSVWINKNIVIIYLVLFPHSITLNNHDHDNNDIYNDKSIDNDNSKMIIIIIILIKTQNKTQVFNLQCMN